MNKNNTNDLVSVVITTYKRSFKVVRRSIDSVLAQTYVPIEIILVDDNNVGDEYRKSIMEELRKYPLINHVKHERNSGAQMSRNDGIRNAKGKYVAFLDDDDEWMSDKIEKQMRLFNNEVGLVYCNGYRIDYESGEEKERIYSKTVPLKKTVSFEDMLYKDYIGTTTQAIIHKDVFDVCGLFDVDQPARQDYEMWLRISKSFKCVGIDEPLFKHYIHQNEQISKDAKKAFIGYKNIYYKYKNDYKKNIFAKINILRSIKYSAVYAGLNKEKKHYNVLMRFAMLTAMFVNIKKFYYTILKIALEKKC